MNLSEQTLVELLEDETKFNSNSIEEIGLFYQVYGCYDQWEAKGVRTVMADALFCLERAKVLE